jgi:hypothetical protein
MRAARYRVSQRRFDLLATACSEKLEMLSPERAEAERARDHYLLK